MEQVIPREKQNAILAQIASVEQRYQVCVLHAIESGSRAWGFPSADSDYDVRLIYCHAPEWYITAFRKKDHLELAPMGDLDIAGWDIGKCLRLLYKGNAVVHEWLHSPVVYRSYSQRLAPLAALACEVFNPRAVFYHYYSLAKKKFLEPSTRKNAKSFLYGLRALLCARWIAEQSTAPPVLFSKLSQRYLSDEEQSALGVLLQQKEQRSEQADDYIEAVLWDECLRKMAMLAETAIESRKEGDSARYDEVLRALLLVQSK